MLKTRKRILVPLLTLTNIKSNSWFMFKPQPALFHTEDKKNDVCPTSASAGKYVRDRSMHLIGSLIPGGYILITASGRRSSEWLMLESAERIVCLYPQLFSEQPNPLVSHDQEQNHFFFNCIILQNCGTVSGQRDKFQTRM